MKYCRGSRMQLPDCFIPCGVQSGTAHDGQLLKRGEGEWRLFQQDVIEEGIQRVIATLSLQVNFG